MERFTLLTYLILMLTTAMAQPKTLTPQEREKAVQLLQSTEKGVFEAIKSLNEEQLNFKPAADQWSVAECLKHIAAAEKELWAMAAPALTQAPNPEKKSSLIFKTDKALVQAVEDRSHKSKTFAALEPANSPYRTLPEALTAFKASRAKLIAFVQTTQTDLRNHILSLPVGTFDTYQFVLLIAAHTDRHTQQLKEVMTNVNFPK